MNKSILISILLTVKTLHSLHNLGNNVFLLPGFLLLGSLLLLRRNDHLLACVADLEDVGGEGVGGAVDAQLHPRGAGAAAAHAPEGEAAGGAAGRGRRGVRHKLDSEQGAEQNGGDNNYCSNCNF